METFEINKVGEVTKTNTRTLILMKSIEVETDAGPILSRRFPRISVDAEKFDTSGKEAGSTIDLPMEQLKYEMREFIPTEGDRAGEVMEFEWIVAKDI